MHKYEKKQTDEHQTIEKVQEYVESITLQEQFYLKIWCCIMAIEGHLNFSPKCKLSISSHWYKCPSSLHFLSPLATDPSTSDSIFWSWCFIISNLLTYLIKFTQCPACLNNNNVPSSDQQEQQTWVFLTSVVTNRETRFDVDNGAQILQHNPAPNVKSCLKLLRYPIKASPAIWDHTCHMTQVKMPNHNRRPAVDVSALQGCADLGSWTRLVIHKDGFSTWHLGTAVWARPFRRLDV